MLADRLMIEEIILDWEVVVDGEPDGESLKCVEVTIVEVDGTVGKALLELFESMLEAIVLKVDGEVEPKGDVLDAEGVVLESAVADTVLDNKGEVPDFGEVEGAVLEVERRALEMEG